MTKDQGPRTKSSASPWPHRAAVLLVCATFGLLVLGGLVTTTGSGMAFPAWLTIDGRFFLFYPLQRWLGGAPDQFIEHGHRLWATLVGLLTIALALLLWRSDRRRWMQRLGLAAVGLVSLQGLLGGLRVNLNETTYAMVHGCVGPVFFGLTVALAVLTSRLWRRSPEVHEAAGKLHRLAIITTALAYVQLVVGAWLRHRPANASPDEFRVSVFFHLLLAAALLVHVSLLLVRVGRHGHHRSLVLPAVALAGLLVIQLALGGGTWVLKYSWPAWFSEYAFAQSFVVTSGSPAQVWITTAHVAAGSLIFGVSLALTLRSLRLLRGVVQTEQRTITPFTLEAAR